MKNKNIILLVSAFLFIFLCLPGIGISMDKIQWYTFEEGETTGKQAGKKVFLYVYSNNCPYCDLMAQNTFSNSAVIQYLNQHFISIKVNSDEEKGLSRRYKIRGNPTNIFIAEDFETIGSLPGYIPPADLLNIMKYIHTDSYKNMTLKAFLKQH